MRIDVIYGFAVDPDPHQHLAQEYLLGYGTTSTAQTPWFGGVILATLLDDDAPLDVTAFDTINGLIDDSSATLATFDDWLANTDEGQALHRAGGTVAPAILLLTVAPGCPAP